MSRWIRGIYNATANFNLSNALRATSLGGLGRNVKQLHTKSDKPIEHIKSNKSCESDKPYKSGTHGCPNHSTRTCNCPTGTCDDDNSTNLHVDGCICSICREYNEYTSYTASVRTEGQGAGTRIRFSNESRSAKQPDTDATRTNIEHITGIPTGVTI
jgi:hypothetical protein